jgi:hypothetical protein
VVVTSHLVKNSKFLDKVDIFTIFTYFYDGGRRQFTAGTLASPGGVHGANGGKAGQALAGAKSGRREQPRLDRDVTGDSRLQRNYH